MKNLWIHYIIQTRVIISIALLTFYSCTSSETYKPKVIIEKNQDAVLGEKYKIKIYPNSSSITIKRAYFQCRGDNRTIDTLSYRINNCNKQLSVKNDTVRISFVPNIIGEKKFEDLSLVIVRDNIIEILDTTFYYNVER